MAAGKLQEILPQRPINDKGQNLVNLGLLAVAHSCGRYAGGASGEDSDFSR